MHGRYRLHDWATVYVRKVKVQIAERDCRDCMPTVVVYT